MAISYKQFWYLLVEREMNIESLEKICFALVCRIENIIENYRIEVEQNWLIYHKLKEMRCLNI